LNCHPQQAARCATTSDAAARLSGKEAHLSNRYRTPVREIDTSAMEKGSYRIAEQGLPPGFTRRFFRRGKRSTRFTKTEH